MPENKILILISAASNDEAAKIGRMLVEKKLAACCSIIPKVQSIFWWEGKITEDAEALLLVKTVKAVEQKVIDEVSAVHSYEVPEIISIGLKGGLEKFFNWVDESVIKDG